MTLNCHICKKELELLDGNFICPDGHVSHYTQEVMEEDQKNISERSRKIHTKNQEPTFLKVYKFFTMMYIKMKSYLEIESDLVFKLMLTYHHGDSIEIFTFNCLYTVLYYSLRAQREKNYLTLCKEEFEAMFSRSYYMNNFNKYINEYNLVNNRDIFTKFMLDKPVACVSLLEWMKLFGNVCYKTKGSSCFTPSILQKENLEVKRIFRAMVRRDEKMMQLYLEKVCDHLGITRTNNMEYHFHRLCNFFLDSKRVFMPDLVVCLFLYLYAARNDLEIDIKRTEERLCYKEDIIDLFRREINEQIFMINTKADLGRFRIYQKEYSVEKTFKPLCKFNKKLNMLKYIFSVYMHSTEDIFMWLVNCMAIFMDYACVNNLQKYLENEMKVNLELLNGKVKAVRCQSEEVQARRKERKMKAEEKINEKKENRAIKNEERRKMRKNKTEKSAHQ